MWDYIRTYLRTEPSPLGLSKLNIEGGKTLQGS